MQVNRYRSFLRVSMAVTAVALIFDSGLLFPITRQLSDNTFSYLASVSAGVGTTAAVPENELNVLTAQITQKQTELEKREAALREREIASRKYETTAETNYSTYIMSVILFILTVLIVLNYAMDWSRMRTLRYGK